MKTYSEEEVKELCRKAYEFGNDQCVLDLNMASFEKWWIGHNNYTGGHQGRLNIYPPIEDDGSHNRKMLDREIKDLSKTFGDEDVDEGEWKDEYWKDAQNNNDEMGFEDGDILDNPNVGPLSF